MPNRIFHEIKSKLSDHDQPLLISGTEKSSTAWVISELYRLSTAPRVHLVVCADNARANELRRDLQFFLDSTQVRHYPERPWHSTKTVLLHETHGRERLSTLQSLQLGWHGLIVAPLRSLKQPTVPRSIWHNSTQLLQVGQEYELARLCRLWGEIGYERQSLTREPGEFSQRGYIIDCFPTDATTPYRLEFDGDRLESIRPFDPHSQRSLTESMPAMDQIQIPPFSEIILNADTITRFSSELKNMADAHDIPKSQRDTLLDSLKDSFRHTAFEDCLPLFYPSDEGPTLLTHYCQQPLQLYWVHAHAIAKREESLAQEIKEHLVTVRSGQATLFDPNLFVDESTLWKNAPSKLSVHLEQLPETFSHSVQEIKLDCQHLPPTTRFMTERLRGYNDLGYQITIACMHETQKARLNGWLLKTETPTQRITLKVGELSRGFIIADEQLLFISDREIFGISARSVDREVLATETPNESMAALQTRFQEGCLVVHLDHGIGRYLGLKHLTIGAQESDFVHLEYQGGDKLYLPVYRLNLIQPYGGTVGDEEPAIVLDKLGGTAWVAKKSKARQAMREMAKELIKLYASRKIITRQTYNRDDPSFNEFEAAFPFSETRDQARAIAEVLKDMEAPRPMDRLICGDVGFGKTEVALRAAYLAVLNRKQVAVLAPTTLLAEQHHVTFKERCDRFGVKVESLSRFKNARQQKAVLADLKDGKVDIIVGTHRLLSKDVNFHDLGLLIIDEEHRFGVGHKEKIKQLRAKIDVIALTATPIPRTLQLSLYGFRDLSTIETAPVGRQGIQTHIAKFDDSLIRSIVLAELKRGGQLFFVHNRIHTIDAMEKYLTRLIPEARIVSVHGEVSEKSLETAMQRFLHKEVDILLATTIIESGLDFPNANTILINRADHLGLAQLYQLRGRVGRSDRQAFAYLLIPGEELISESAEKRLRALRSFTELGSGYRIALRDLEIRGAGNLLGTHQSGHIRAIGMDLYIKLLETTVKEMQGEVIVEEIEPELQIHLPAYLPDSYIAEEELRVSIYLRISYCKSERELQSIAAELEDRFGEFPEPVSHLLKIMELKLLAKSLTIRRLQLSAPSLLLDFAPQTQLQPTALLKWLAQFRGQAKMLSGSTVYIPTTGNDKVFNLATVKKLLLELAEYVTQDSQ